MNKAFSDAPSRPGSKHNLLTIVGRRSTYCDDVVELDKASVWNLEQGVSNLMEKMDFTRAVS